MVNKGLKRAPLYFTAFIAVCFGMEWGFSYILSARREDALRPEKSGRESRAGQGAL